MNSKLILILLLFMVAIEVQIIALSYRSTANKEVITETVSTISDMADYILAEHNDG